MTHVCAAEEGIGFTVSFPRFQTSLAEGSVTAVLVNSLKREKSRRLAGGLPRQPNWILVLVPLGLRADFMSTRRRSWADQTKRFPS